MPVFNAMAITVMMDRWRSETHSFHLPCGEMMVTLKDVAMILGLRIRGRPITGCVDSAGWHERVTVFIDREPPARVPGIKGREAGVHMSWLCEEFCECPPDADEATVTMYTRAWVSHMFATVLFPDSTGDAASWMYILALAHWHEVGSYSWGSTVLAYLYRQLCDACRRRGKISDLRGCVYLLHVSATTSIYFSLHLLPNHDGTLLVFILLVWMVMRLPVGRPRCHVPQGPTASYLWDVVTVPHATQARAHIEYNNKLDALMLSSVSTCYSFPSVVSL
jgi:hypothetical protein